MPIHRVLVVDPDRASRETLLAAARALGLRAQEAGGLRHVGERLATTPPDLLLVDASAGDRDQLDAIRARHPELPIALLRPAGMEDAAPHDCEELRKPCTQESLASLLARVERDARLRRENAYLRGELLGATENGLVARSAAMAEALRAAARSARSRGAVLVTGEHGTGRRRLAHYVHFHSPRAARPIVRLCCAGLSSSELAARLFGDADESWTGSGVLEVADGGTLLLEEIQELPIELQERLHAVLVAGVLPGVGTSAPPAPLDVRLIATSRSELEALAAGGQLTPELQRMLGELTIRLQPLRERAEDVLPLAVQFASQAAIELGKPLLRITTEAEERLRAWTWPGNARELECVVQRAAILARGHEIGAAELALGSDATGGSRGASGAREDGSNGEDLSRRLANLPIADIERIAILATLESTGGNKTEAARRLGLTARTLSNKLKLWRSQGLVS